MTRIDSPADDPVFVEDRTLNHDVLIVQTTTVVGIVRDEHVAGCNRFPMHGDRRCDCMIAHAKMMSDSTATRE